LRRRHADPSLAYLAAGGIVIASPVFFPLALGIYLILRPSETLAEARTQRLAELAIELEDEVERCPECGVLTEEDWLACPSCRTRLGHRCVGCSRTMGLDWIACAWCATEVPDAGDIAQTELPGPRLVPAGPGLGIPGPAPVAVSVAALAAEPTERIEPPESPPADDERLGTTHPEHVAAATTGSVAPPAGTFLGRRFAINRHR
jgi:hypothetical protein